MRYLALACDFDGTLARDGTVSGEVARALRRFRESRWRLVLVTGRELIDLQAVFPQLDLLDSVVAENGGTLYRPSSGMERALAPSPHKEFVEALLARGVSPLGVGRVIVATRTPNETTVLETIRDLGLELQVIFNKGAVMVLPSGVNKASGLTAALAELGVSPGAVIAIGDGENDHALLDLAAVGVAVANAVPGLRERADIVTTGADGEGVIEVIDRLLSNSFSSLLPHVRP